MPSADLLKVSLALSELTETGGSICQLVPLHRNQVTWSFLVL